MENIENVNIEELENEVLAEVEEDILSQEDCSDEECSGNTGSVVLAGAAVIGTLAAVVSGLVYKKVLKPNIEKGKAKFQDWKASRKSKKSEAEDNIVIINDVEISED